MAFLYLCKQKKKGIKEIIIICELCFTIISRNIYIVFEKTRPDKLLLQFRAVGQWQLLLVRLGSDALKLHKNAKIKKSHQWTDQPTNGGNTFAF